MEQMVARIPNKTTTNITTNTNIEREYELIKNKKQKYNKTKNK
jgi:hypothetical protein